MKLSQIFAVAAAFCITAVTLNAAEGSARVSRVKGAARWSADNKNWKTLAEGDILKSGAVIQTASESWVDVILYDAEFTYSQPQPVVRQFNYGVGQDAQQNVIRLRENTVLAIDRLFSQGTGSGNVTETQLDLRAGRVFGNVKKLSGASKYEVKLPNGVAGIRGTLFDLSANGILTVFFGSVAISYYDGSGQLVTKVVLANERLDLNTNQLTRLTGSEGKDGTQEGEFMGSQGGNTPGGPQCGPIEIPPSRYVPVVVTLTPQDEPPPQEEQSRGRPGH
ncbi:MAG: hypothetical protein RL380_752 [Verrucomicrobiota bacterium]|jgi:hypothetical protein